MTKTPSPTTIELPAEPEFATTEVLDAVIERYFARRAETDNDAPGPVTRGVAYAKERHMTDTTTTKPDTEVMPTTAIPSVMETEDHAAAGYYRICTSVRVGETWVCVEGFAHFDNQAEADAAAARVKVEVFA